MASIIWALLLFLAQLHTLLYTSTVHVDAGNLTHQSVSFLCRPDQAEALLQLKGSFSFARSTTRLPSWRDSTDCCLWEGVGCDTSSGNVTVLDLNNRGLSSFGLDPVIFNLTSLRRLDLSMNDFSGGDPIPPTGFERFTLLTHLNLSDSGFRGQIPVGIRKLVKLASLDLSSSIDNDDGNLVALSHSPSNDYDDDNLFSEFSHHHNNLQEPNFDTLVSSLSNLRELRLDGVDLDMSSSGVDWCVTLAKSVPLLQVLSLGNCGLRGPIHKSLSSLRSLVVINLQENDLLTAGPFPEFLMDFPSLAVLQLSDINLQGWFPTKSFQSRDLRVLDLSKNLYLSGHLPNLANVSSLETLRLQGTNFSYARPTSSSNFKLLKELSLDGNLVSVEFLSSLGKLGSLRQLNLLGFDSVIELGSIFAWIGEHKTLKSLELQGCNFSMALPSVVSNFVSLRSLAMIDCDIPTTTFSALGNLMDLRALKMDGCKTDGPMPSSIGNLTNLRDIYISSSWFSGPLPVVLGNLTNLRHICIISSGFFGPLPTVLGNLINLETLQINDGEFSGVIPNSIGQLSKLTQLRLDRCNFSGKIPSSIVNLTRLTQLSIYSNRLSGEIPSSIFILPVLHELALSDNLLSGPIREFDNVSSQLEFVDLRRNELSGSIPKAFFRLTSLNYLDMSRNNLIGFVDLTSFLRLRWLIGLDLSHNKLSVMEGEDINPSSTNLPGVLTNLLLASCNINRFPESLALMNRISTLDLSCNKMIGDVPSWIWETWSNSLSYLNLSHNMLTNMQLTSDILPAHVLNILDLSFNGLKGRIPMPKSSSLFLLDYSNNRFSSVLPNWASYLAGTEYLSMSNNSINGHIPLSICNNSSLSFLDLSHNNFSGPVPSCLIENGQLYVLNLRENQFEGTLPSNITSCSFQTLDLHGNKIEGQLSRGLSKCQDLEVLDFGSNRIVDTFPSWLRGLPSLLVIVLRSNKFYGTIGDAFGDIKYEEFFRSLRIIDLSSNNFSGNLRPQWIERLKSMMTKFDSAGETIADYNPFRPMHEVYQDSVEIVYKGSEVTFVRVLTTLTAIDFSNNRLEGTIPESIGKLVSLRLLNLSHNAFTGKIPAKLGGMTDLEALDLSGNQISGVIPEELTSLTFLAFLNLSDNHLVGKIPQSRQFSTFGCSSFEGNAGLFGPQLSELPCGASPYTPAVTNEHKSSHHVDVILFLFVGLGFGVGFAAAIVVQWGQIGRRLNATARALRT